jgi:hypothetical protein
MDRRLNHSAARARLSLRSNLDDLIQPDLPRAPFISYLTAPAIKTNKRMAGI